MNTKDLVDELSEAGVIASLIYNPELCYHSEDLTERHFSDPVNSAMYYAINSLVKKDIFEIDAINILSVISDNPKLKKMYGHITADTINEIISLGQSVARSSVDEYKNLAENIRSKAFRRNMYLKLKQCERLCFEDTEEDIQQVVLDEINNVINDFSTMEDVKPMSSMIDELWEEVENVQTSGSFLDFKFKELNKFCRMAKQETIVLAAREKRGKSMFLLNTLCTQLENNESVLYIDTEISDRQFFMRLISHLAQVTYKSLETGTLTPEEKMRVKEAREYLKTKNFTHIYMPVLDDSQLVSTVNRIKNKYGLTSLIVDYIKSNTAYSMDAFKNSAYLGKITDTVKGLAGKLNIYTIACVQANRDGTVANSQNIARNCSTLIMMDRKTDQEIIEDGGLEYGNMKLHVSANRNGRLHSDDEYISITLDGDRCTFRDCKQPERKEPY